MLNSLETLASTLPRAAFCFWVAAMALAVFTGFRVWLLSERLSDLGELSGTQRLKLFLVGFHLDSLMVSRGTLIIITILLLVPEGWIPLLRPALLTYAGVLFFLIFLAETAGVYFFRYYDFRPNYLVLEHGSDPEVLRTIAKDYPVIRILLLAAVGTGVCLFLLSRLAALETGTIATPGALYPRPWDQLGTLLLLLLAAFAARGTLDRRPLNPSAAAVTTNRVANEIAASGIFNVLYEWAQHSKKQYGNLKSLLPLLSMPEATRRARDYLSAQGRLTDDSPNPLVRLVAGKERVKPLNVVVIVMESFTSRLVGAVGGSPALTPELDRLALEGILLENCYATGERTIQALEAAIASFPPLPGVSVVRRPQARQGFATLATPLKARGYATLFLYGGQGIFDHMRAFFVGNGFDVFIEEKDFDQVDFRTPWGASDEDLFRRADREFRRYAGQGKPFFATILTVSLHSPWEYPEGRIQPLPPATPVPPGFKYEELNNFLYADYALGQFIRQARTAPYFDDTLFVFVGDHGVHLRGRELIPVDEYRVPALFLAPKHIRSRRIPRVTSQLDIPPTIMAILGGSYRSPFFGQEILSRENDDGMAIMIYNKKRYGILSGPHLTVIAESGKELVFERGDGLGPWKAVPLTPNQHNYSRNAIALLEIAEHLLKTGRYTTALQIAPSSPTLKV